MVCLQTLSSDLGVANTPFSLHDVLCLVWLASPMELTVSILPPISLSHNVRILSHGVNVPHVHMTHSLPNPPFPNPIN